MTSNVNLWMNIPNLYTSSSSTGTNSTTTSDFVSYLLNATASTDNNSTTANSIEASLSELSYGQNTASHSNLYGNLTDTSTSTTQTTSTMSDYLQTIFQAQQLKSLTTAKEKLQTEMINFAATVDENISLADQQKIEKMKNNISTLSDYLTTKTSTISSENNLLSSFTSSTSPNSTLLSTLSASSALSQYLLSKNEV
ncbi:hypothetical protein AEA09_04180 [Lysinibacillus contaminans]|uniref:Uncharacterized protein n=1 Tax=Lysinibacillus contaminans TaxID=1293441 RepID=A0ABR5K0B2_9BACI|nr:hypothetical protein [Lysinibacillus contaminans]KOS67829.1 hypothetical protein AEA09_04180 [Lysinibacillus contaminans]